MKHVFDMKVSPYTGTAEILLNGLQLSSQSQLRVCSIDHFSKWYKDLPDLLYSEVNDDYTLNVQCVEIEYLMLMAVLSGRADCSNLVYTAITRKYDSKTRCQWLKEAANNSGITIPSSSCFSIIATADALNYRTSIANQLDSFTRDRCSDKKEQVTIIITTKNSYSEAKNLVASDNDIIFVIDDSLSGMAIEMGKCLAISTNEKSVKSLMQQWIDITIFYPYMMFCHSKIINAGRTLSFYSNARLQMLTQDDPVVNSKMPSKLESGLTASVVLDEFPNSSLTIRSCDSSIVTVKNGMIQALKVGTTNIEIIAESGKTVCTHKISVFFVPRVTSISLSVANGNTVLEGALFTVNVKYTPTNATNLANAKWSCTPTSSLREVGIGRFEALSPGTCTITLQVDKVSQSIVVQIMPLAKKIKMVPEVRMKVNAAPTPFHASLEPVGSGCSNLEVKVLDTSIAQWNPSAKAIVPISEGDTSLEVSAIDAKGNAIFVQNCKVSILPEKDIITPPTYPTIIVVCAILSLITATTIMSPLIAACGGVVSIVELIYNLGPVLKKNGTRSNNIEVGFGIAGVLACILALSCYFLI